jgi:3-oxoadipate enol-lactonase
VAVLAVPGTELFYEERGAGPPVLWLQGLGADHTAWSAQLIAFSRGYHCLAPDNRGSGKTAPHGPLSLRLLAEDVAALLRARAGGEAAHVVGLSLGAAIAVELALLAPAMVRSLVLVSAGAYVEPRMRELFLAWRAIYPQVPAAVFQQQANTWLFSWRFFERPRAVEGVVRYAERTAVPAAWFTAQVDAVLEHDHRQRLAEVMAPALVLTGQEDQMIPPRLGCELAAALPNASYVEIAEAGHSVNLEQQRRFNDAVRAFFEQH